MSVKAAQQMRRRHGTRGGSLLFRFFPLPSDRNISKSVYSLLFSFFNLVYRGDDSAHRVLTEPSNNIANSYCPTTEHKSPMDS